MAEARFQKVDETNISDHYHLTPDDECYFLHEYTSGRGYNFGYTNDLISNLKKKPSRRGLPDYKYKLRAMRDCAKSLGEAINPGWLQQATLVPVPPSKVRTNPEHDDRMLQICRNIQRPFPVDVRELVIQREDIRAAHESEHDRPTVEQLLEIYEVDEALANPAPTAIAIVDDVLTAGVHYRAVHTVLANRFPGIQIVGMFIARRVFPTERLDEIFDIFE